MERTQEMLEDYKEISFVCVRQDGMYLGREALEWMCRSIAKHVFVMNVCFYGKEAGDDVDGKYNSSKSGRWVKSDELFKDLGTDTTTAIRMFFNTSISCSIER